MLRTIFYGLSHGVVSGRKLADVCRNDNRYIVLSGDSRPDCRTFHRFREASVPVSIAEQLTPGDAPHAYLCPAVKPLPVASRRKDGSTEVRLPEGICGACPLRGNCRLRTKSGKSFKVPAEPDRQAMARHHARMRDPEARKAYSRRKVICEPVFGNIKNKGMRILVRGKAKVAAWWKLAAAAHNVEKIVGHMAAAAAAST